MPAANVNTRSNELQNIIDWTITNNLSPNLSKSEEIVFVDKRRKHKFDIIKNNRRIKTCGKVTLHLKRSGFNALKVLRGHGLCETAIQAVFRSVILVRLLYASPAYLHGGSLLESKTGKRFMAFCAVATRLASALLVYLVSTTSACNPTKTCLEKSCTIQTMYYTAFFRLSPVPLSLRPRTHNRVLPDRLTRLADFNLIIRTMMFHGTY